MSLDPPIYSPQLPTRLNNAGNVTPKRQLPKTKPAHLELSKETARPAANPAAIPLTNLELRRL